MTAFGAARSSLSDRKGMPLVQAKRMFDSNRALSLPLQADPLLEVFGFASRDELDALQLTCKFWRAIVDNAADTLALRPLEYVTIVCLTAK